MLLVGKEQPSSGGKYLHHHDAVYLLSFEIDFPTLLCTYQKIYTRLVQK